MPPLTPSVRDHLQAGSPLPEWVFDLGERIHRLTACPAAIAASRARDLYRVQPLARALEQVLCGGETLMKIDPARLTHLQRETLQRVLSDLLQALSQTFQEEKTDDL